MYVNIYIDGNEKQSFIDVYNSLESFQFVNIICFDAFDLETAITDPQQNVIIEQ